MNRSADMASLVPDPNNLLELTPEEQGKLLLKLLLPATPESPVAHSNFFSRGDDFANPPKYGARQKDVDKALMEAWGWLENQGLLVKAASSAGSWFFVSKAGHQLASEVNTASFRNTGLFPKHQLHPVIAEKVYPAFLRGKYDTAIFEAFREIEIAVRQACRLPQDLVGDNLMRAAFTPAENNRPAGQLADTQLPAGEQRAMSHLFAGAFGVYRNSTGHRHVPTDAAEAVEVIMFASQLMRTVERLKLKAALPPPAQL